MSEPENLSSLVWSSRSIDGMTRAVVLAALAESLDEDSLEIRAAQLALAALGYSAPHLVPRLSHRNGTPPWWPVWASTVKESPYRHLFPPGQPVEHIALTTTASPHALIVTGSAAHVLGLRTGAKIASFTFAGDVRAVTACGPYAVIAAQNDGIHVIDLSTGRPAAQPHSVSDARALAARVSGTGVLSIVVGQYGDEPHRGTVSAYTVELHAQPAGWTLPETGWGSVVLTGSRQYAGSAWTDDGKPDEERQLKHRSRKDVRRIPLHPELVAILRRTSMDSRHV